MTEQPVIECPPTPETLRHHEGNIVIGGGRMTKGVPQLRYRNHYEIIADPDVDALDGDYSQCVSRLEAARYAYLLSQKATAGWRADTSNDGDGEGMPLADLYTALLLRFAQQKRAVRAYSEKITDHWATLMMLISPLGDGKNARATRNAMFPFVPEITTALTLLEEFSQDIQKAYRKKREAETRAEEIPCHGNQDEIN